MFLIQHLIDKAGGFGERVVVALEQPGHLGQSLSHIIPLRLVLKQTEGSGGEVFTRHPLLDQFGDNLSSGDQIDHRIKRNIHEEAPDPPAQTSYPIETDGRGAEQGGLHRDRAGGG